VKNSTKSLILLTAVASLAAFADKKGAPAKAGKETAQVRCEGVNECKGKGACGGANHDCAGGNECKGKGWIMLTDAECKAKGGKITGSGKM